MDWVERTEKRRFLLALIMSPGPAKNAFTVLDFYTDFSRVTGNDGERNEYTQEAQS